MSKRSRIEARIDCNLVEVKSKFDAEFRRFSVDRLSSKKFDDFEILLKLTHKLKDIPILICYTDTDGDLLPINNDDNYQKALSTAKPVLRVIIQKKGSLGEINGYGTVTLRKKGRISKIIGQEVKPKSHIPISLPEDFRRVSAIIDVDVVPETHRRVKLMKNGTDKPLGFYIRDGTSVRVTPHGLEKVPGIFISRLVPGGLAESTGLLAVNDEVLEVNGIEVAGKTLDQVTDMMVANSSNLIVTVKPVNQRNNIVPSRGGSGRTSQKSTDSYQSARSLQSLDSDDVREIVHPDDDDDLIQDHITPIETSPPVSLPEVSLTSENSDLQEIPSTGSPGLTRSTKIENLATEEVQTKVESMNIVSSTEQSKGDGLAIGSESKSAEEPVVTL